MTPDQQDLARALVALPGWRWKPGMLAWRGETGPRGGEGEKARVIRCFKDGVPATFDWHGRFVPCHYVHQGDDTPDLTDPATAGLLVQMLPGPWRAQTAEREGGTVYRVTATAADGRPWDSGWCGTLGEAAARACVAAGRREP